MMDMGSATSSSGMASSTMAGMDMASSTSSSMSMSTSSSDSMDMDMASMHMYFTTDYNNYPVLFSTLKADTKAKAFGIFALLFFIAFTVRGIEFTRLYLEQKVWKNPAFLGGDCGALTTNESRSSLNRKTDASTAVMEAVGCCGGKESEVSSEEVEPLEGNIPGARDPHRLRLASSLFRDCIRIVLCIIPDMFSFALMLATMSFCLVYFFAVVIGLGLGRFYFEKLSMKHNLRAVTSGYCG
ncbi:copper transport protein Ctr1p [[Candida] railenensis]|uniref:Copper transport protein n=1 Tax=[Candida] railenensis TaxID=45579 RepID=A0A9P0QKL2_9ASCO|nr:copper transport protein Ctr1p [[Candida] railenensis]